MNIPTGREREQENGIRRGEDGGNRSKRESGKRDHPVQELLEDDLTKPLSSLKSYAT